MPYIKDKVIRAILDNVSDTLVLILSGYGIKGNLNYFLFRTAKHLCRKYKDFSDFEGDCQQSLKEIYRRLEASYEDKKIKENGDIE